MSIAPSPVQGTSPPPPPAPGNDSFASPPSPPVDSNTTASPPGGGGTGVLPSPPPPGVAGPPFGPPKKGLPPGALAGLIVGLALGAVIVLIFVGIFVFFYRRKKRKAAEKLSGDVPSSGPKDKFQVGPPQYRQQSIPPAPPRPPSAGMRLDSEKSSVAGIEVGFSQNTFSLEELTTATDAFSDANLLGQGGFGYVHKGVLSNGTVVAIKQLKAGSGQGEREFRAEIEIISRVHHRHLVSLVGYCITGAQRMLVYEFVPNGTLEFHLHGKDKPTMDWSTRMKIAVGAAKGLAYLHEDCRPKIIHRDIKAANILLDYSFEPKVADFGLAKHSLDTDTHVSTRVMGTFGYMAPEYASTGKLTDRSDVFSFGVVLLELITGHRPVDRTQCFLDESIVDWARPLMKQALEDENYNALVDSKLQNYDSFEMKRIICCAAACVRHSARLRPSMSQIVRALEGNIPLDELSDGILPGQSMAFSSHGSSDYSSSQYKEDLKNFKKIALESQELVSSDYSVPTSEFGLQPSSSSTEGQYTQEKDSHGVEKNARDSHPSS
ncbi:hypothetical protein K2173_024263 [Erythroxylum novogranatense]|uniref:non-specific serine/threonine protein kinase n=1 Tax=Erythroxylum novogranatense TaxID=1862640 RepID=A0AAV8SUM4_9ROSI|nr:hypothetical protein K2173_024263 [Erythroxylum novogranatense]